VRLRATAIATILLLAALALAGPATAATSGVRLTATVNGVDVASASQGHPLKLVPSQPARIRLTINNASSSAITVATVKLSGRVAGLTFFAFYTSVDFTVFAGTTQELDYSLNLTGLSGQATGLIGGSLEIEDQHNHKIASIATVTDVRGSIYSVYGLFGLALVVLTLLALADNALAIARHKMPANRWRRGLRVMTPGIGIGLVLVFTMSAVRVWVPSPAKWWLVGAIFAVVFFALGYLTPTPVIEEDEDDDVHYYEPPPVGEGHPEYVVPPPPPPPVGFVPPPVPPSPPSTPPPPSTPEVGRLW
jgi:hypothetical protein